MFTIELPTAQNVPIEYELASLRERFLALFIDLLIIGGGYYALVILLAIATEGGSLNALDGMTARVVFYLAPIALFVLYHFYSELLADGQSWGKKAMGIKVVKMDGAESRTSDYLIRAVFYMIDFILSIGIIGVLSILSSPKKQRLGDRAAHTTVVRLNSRLRFELEDIFKIDSIEDYEPTYEEVKQLSEEDMLLIKRALTRYKKYPNEAHGKVLFDMATHLTDLLQVMPTTKTSSEDFLKHLVRDYIVLTR